MSSIQESQTAFADMMSATTQDGVIDARTKELMIFACLVLSRCEPCLKVHLEKAKNMGISQEELDEAAWCAIAMGGAPVKLFYSSYMENSGE